MLTATYSNVAISAEQNNARNALAILQQNIRSIWKNFKEIDFTSIEIAIQKLTQFDQFFRSRKVEKYVIPAIKNATHAVDSLLAELDALSAFCVRILESLPHQMHQALDQGLIKQKELRRAMELYCSNLQLRLVKEEQELLPLVQQVLTGEEIFELGAQFLSEDGKKLQDQQAKLDIEPPIPGA